MGIKFRCHACDKKLHVKAFLAGKRGVCPRCGAKVQIPHESQITSRTVVGTETVREGATQEGATKSGGKTSSATRRESMATEKHTSSDAAERASASQPAPGLPDPIAEAPDVVWYVRPPSGGEYGPANGEIMQRWLDEGRVSSDSMVWREGWPDWREASGVFPRFAEQAGPVAVAEPVVTAAPASEPSVGLSTDSRSGRGRQPIPGRRAPRRPMTTIIIMSVISVILLGVLAIVLLTQ